MTAKSKSKLEKVSDDIVKTFDEPESPCSFKNRIFVSTGSTLLDLAISGGIHREGGIPGGILVEFFGEEASGKSSLLSEICTNVEQKGGKILIADVERRLNAEYAKIYGLKITSENYRTPQTIEEFFSLLHELPENDIINLLGADSLAAMTTARELEEGDKMGAHKARVFSQELRRAKAIIAKQNNLVICTNQARENIGAWGNKITTSGGRAIKHHASLRIRLDIVDSLITKKTIQGKIHSKAYGIVSKCRIEKSSIDDPYRDAKIYLVFNYGIDDIRANLEYLKSISGSDSYEGGHKKINIAIEHIENGGEKAINELKEKVISIWHEVESSFKTDRLPKIRK